MTEKQPLGRRQEFMDKREGREGPPGDPIELPMGTSRPAKTMAQQIQEQIAIQLSKKPSG